jgi:hypothetical protein
MQQKVKVIHFDRMETIKEKMVKASGKGRYKPICSSNEIAQEWVRLRFGEFGRELTRKLIEKEEKKKKQPR